MMKALRRLFKCKVILEKVGPWLYLGLKRHVGCGVYELGFYPLAKVRVRSR